MGAQAAEVRSIEKLLHVKPYALELFSRLACDRDAKINDELFVGGVASFKLAFFERVQVTNHVRGETGALQRWNQS